MIFSFYAAQIEELASKTDWDLLKRKMNELGENCKQMLLHWADGISDKEIVVLDQTSPRLFHGHVRLWKELTQEMKNALVDAGLCTLKGKIK